MNSSQSVRVALRELRGRPLRSLLTAFGIIIGVCAAIATVAVGQGAQRDIAERIEQLGANVLMVLPVSSRAGALRNASDAGHTLSVDDASAIAELSSVEASAPSVRGSANFVNGNRNWSSRVNGTTISYFGIRGWTLHQGRWFDDNEARTGARVVLLGQTIARELFGDRRVVGQRVRIGNAPFKIIGTLAAKGVAAGGRDQDDIAFMPFRTAQRRLLGGVRAGRHGSVDYILATAAGSGVDAAKRQIEATLRTRHHRRDRASDGFRVSDPAETLKAQRQTQQTVTWLLTAVASIALMVGGVGVMNMMLVSVADRTREIGLRLALGARSSDVRRQFLIEGLTLCAIGGALGALLGAGVTLIVGHWLGWPVYIAPLLLVGAIAFSAAIGLFFAIYPAHRAARMDPIEALRLD